MTAEIQTRRLTARASRARQLAAVTFASAAIGAAFGFLGVAIEKRNTFKHGDSYSRYNATSLGIRSLPGFIITAHRTGRDLGIGESINLWKGIVGWNAGVYSSLGLAVYSVILYQIKDIPSSK